MREPYLVLLLMKLAVAASLASILIRSGRFQRMLLREERTLAQRLLLAFGGASFFAAGVGARVLIQYSALDLGLEGSLVLGLLGGYVTGLLSGVLISIPAILNGELMSLILFAAVGVLGGLLRDIAPDKEDIWRFSPWPDVSIYRLLRKRDLRRAAFSLTCVIAILLAEMLRSSASRAFGDRGVFALYKGAPDPGALTWVAIYVTTLFATVLPLKIWGNRRNEQKLESQQRLLNEARLAALSRQINPHFLFNTLNTVTSLIRTNPEEARGVVLKLSKILRRLLRKQESLTPLRDELSFVEDYLAIEMVRFGEKLRYVKEVQPETLERLVPSMLLQPLVENSIRHGLSSKVEGGTIRVRSWLAEGRLHLSVADDGVGIPESKLATLFEQGIGVNNVNERLKVLYGDDYRMWIESHPGEGTMTGIEVPELPGALAAVS